MPSTDSKLVVFTKHDFDRAWDKIEPLIEKALERCHGEWTVESLYRGCFNGNMLCWGSVDKDMNIEAIAITQTIDYPGKRICQFLMAAGGNRNHWQHFIKVIEDWAKEQKCDIIEIVGRHGWEKVYKDFTKTYVTLRKELV